MAEWEVRVGKLAPGLGLLAIVTLVLVWGAVLGVLSYTACFAYIFLASYSCFFLVSVRRSCLLRLLSFSPCCLCL